MSEADPKRGRPKADEPGSAVSVWLRQSEHDRLVRLAREHDVSVSSVIRVSLNLSPKPE